MLQEALQLLPKTHEKFLLCAQLKVLSCLLVHIGHLSDDDRGRLGVVDAIRPYLYVADDMRAYAARCLTALLASSASTQAAAASSVAVGRPPLLSKAAEDDADACQLWLWSTGRATDHTAVSLIEVSHVAAALAGYRRAHSLPFLLPWLLEVQLRAAPQRTEQARAWHHLCVAVVDVVAEVLPSPPLAAYAADLVARRLHADPPELPQSFAQRLAKPSVARSGMTLARNVDGEAPLANAEEATDAAASVSASAPSFQVSTLITPSTLVVYLLRSAEAAVLPAFAAPNADALEARLRQLVLEFGDASSALGNTPSRRGAGRRTLSSDGQTLVGGNALFRKEEDSSAVQGLTAAAAGAAAEIKLLPEPLSHAALEAKFADGLGSLLKPHAAQMLLSRFGEVFDVMDSSMAMPPPGDLGVPAPWRPSAVHVNPQSADAHTASGIQLAPHASFTIPHALLLRTTVGTAVTQTRRLMLAPNAILSELDAL